MTIYGYNINTATHVNHFAIETANQGGLCLEVYTRHHIAHLEKNAEMCARFNTTHLHLEQGGRSLLDITPKSISLSSTCKDSSLCTKDMYVQDIHFQKSSIESEHPIHIDANVQYHVGSNRLRIKDGAIFTDAPMWIHSKHMDNMHALYQQVKTLIKQ